MDVQKGSLEPLRKKRFIFMSMKTFMMLVLIQRGLSKMSTCTRGFILLWGISLLLSLRRCCIYESNLCPRYGVHFSKCWVIIEMLFFWWKTTCVRVRKGAISQEALPLLSGCVAAVSVILISGLVGVNNVTFPTSFYLWLLMGIALSLAWVPGGTDQPTTSFSNRRDFHE